MRSNQNQNSLHDNQMNNIGPVSQMGQMVSGMASMNLMSGAPQGPDLRNQKTVYNTKFGSSQVSKGGNDIKNTPQHMISSKIGMKQVNRGDQQSMQFSQGSHQMSNQYAGNMQQPYHNAGNPYKSKCTSEISVVSRIRLTLLSSF